MGMYRSDCCYAADIDFDETGVSYSDIGLCAQCGESCSYNVVLEDSDIHENVEQITAADGFSTSEKQTLKPLKDACIGSLDKKHPPPRAEKLGLVWGQHRRGGLLRTEHHAACGCAYHPVPTPHVHSCKEHNNARK